MIAQSFYVSMTEAEYEENYKNCGLIEKIVVPKRGRFIKSLSLDDDVIVSIITNPDSTIDSGDKNSDVYTITNVTVLCMQPLGPTIMDNILKLYNESVSANNGFVLFWAFEHKFRSILFDAFKKQPSLEKYIDGMIYQHIHNTSYTDMISWLIDQYGYDITKNNNRLFSTAAMNKNISLCEYLLEEKNSIIPANVYCVYRQYGKKRFQAMWKLLKEYSDRVEWR